MWRRIWAITSNTARETLRDRILLAVAVFACFLIAFSLFLGSISLEQNEKIITDIGLAAIFLLQTFITIFAGVQLLSKEIERKTFFLILPKPVRKVEVLVGKYVGFGIVNLFMTLLSTIVLFIILFLKAKTVMAFGPLLLAIGFGFVETMLILLVGMLFSLSVPSLLAAALTASIFLIGHSSSLLFSVIQKQENLFLKYALYGAYYLFPNLEKFNIRNAAAYGGSPDFAQIVLVLFYALAYGAFLFLITLHIFKRRQY